MGIRYAEWGDFITKEYNVMRNHEINDWLNGNQSDAKMHGKVLSKGKAAGLIKEKDPLQKRL